MKYYLILIIAIVFAACTSRKENTETKNETVEVGTLETISPEMFQQKLTQTEGAVILDVRTSPELEGGYIEGATNIDFKSPDFQEKISQLDRNKPYFVYCAGGSRSGKATELMRQLNFKRIYNLDGGFGAWKNQGLPIAQKPE